MVIGRKKYVSDAGSIRTGLLYISCCIVTFYKPDDAFRIIQFQNSDRGNRSQVVHSASFFRKTLDNQWLPIYAASSRVKTQSVLTKTLVTAVSDKPVAKPFAR